MRLAILAAVAILPAAGSAQATIQAPPAPEGFGAPFKARPLADGPVKVGPAKGTVIVVGWRLDGTGDLQGVHRRGGRT